MFTFSQGYKRTALPTADKHQLKPPECEAAEQETHPLLLQIFFPWQFERTPSNYNDDIFISQLELHTALQTKTGIKSKYEPRLYTGTTNHLVSLFEDRMLFSITSSLWCLWTGRPPPPCLQPQSIRTSDRLLPLEHERTTWSLTEGLCHVSLTFLTLKMRHRHKVVSFCGFILDRSSPETLTQEVVTGLYFSLQLYPDTFGMNHVTKLSVV